MKRWPILVIVTAATCAGSAFADVYKCATPPGRVEYRDYPCDANATVGERVDTRANTIGTGETLASIRERGEQMTKRLDARRAAEDRAAERDRELRERAFYEERAYLERQVGDGYAGSGVYWPAYVIPQHRPAKRPPPSSKPPPAIVTKRKVG